MEKPTTGSPSRRDIQFRQVQPLNCGLDEDPFSESDSSPSRTNSSSSLDRDYQLLQTIRPQPAECPAQDLEVLRHLKRYSVNEPQLQSGLALKTETITKKTLLLDLDETLVRTVRYGGESCCYNTFVPASDDLVAVSFRDPYGSIVEAEFVVRPHTAYLLEKLSEHYEIIVSLAKDENGRYSRQVWPRTRTRSCASLIRSASSYLRC